MAGGNKFDGGNELCGEFFGSNSVSTALADNRIRQDSGTWETTKRKSLTTQDSRVESAVNTPRDIPSNILA